MSDFETATIEDFNTEITEINRYLDEDITHPSKRTKRGTLGLARAVIFSCMGRRIHDSEPSDPLVPYSQDLSAAFGVPLGSPYDEDAPQKKLRGVSKLLTLRFVKSFLINRRMILISKRKTSLNPIECAEVNAATMLEHAKERTSFIKAVKDQLDGVRKRRRKK